MFFKTPPKKILAQKNVRFFSFFFNRSKEANRMIGSNFTRPPFSSACKALWGDDAIWFLALAACAQFRFFLLKTTSFVSWPAEAIVMSIQLYQHDPDYSSKEGAEEKPVDSGEQEVS